ncbi:SapC family protein [Sphingomonas sp.]|uniref:SapC family protein n=1 Tax=Sphingomonas sp. TaxID=28214 RepID=UPI003B3A0DD2
MTQLELLNQHVHGDLHLRAWEETSRNFIPLAASEFTAAAAYYPILLTKNAHTGQFYAGAMLGLKPGENLFLDGRGRLSGYRPLDLERQAFFISGEEIAVDRTHPRLGESDGTPLFEDDGRPADPLRRIQRALAQLNSGMAETDQFLQAMLGAELIEPIEVALNFDDGERLILQELYTVSSDRLQQLPDDQVLDLFRRGYLQLAYAQIGSLKQIGSLARRRNDRLSALA